MKKRMNLRYRKTIDNMEEFEAKIIMNELTNSNEWDWISGKFDLPEWFIEKYQNKLDWFCISKFQNLSEELIEKFKDKLDWGEIVFNYELNDKFVEKYLDYIDLDVLLRYQSDYLSKELLEKCRKLNNDKIYTKLKRNGLFGIRTI